MVLLRQEFLFHPDRTRTHPQLHPDARIIEPLPHEVLSLVAFDEIPGDWVSGEADGRFNIILNRAGAELVLVFDQVTVP